MVPSSHDMLAFVAELNGRRIAMVMGNRQKRQGGMFLVSEHQMELLVVARKMHARYISDNYRHDETEIGMLNELGNWLLEEHALNEGLKTVGKFPPLTIGSSRVKSMLPIGTYQKHLEKVHSD